MLKKIWGKLLCLIGDHDWTCKAEEGIKPDKGSFTNPLEGFKEYSKMYCKRCGGVSDLSEE
jgi:hypothetical protein